MRWIASLCLVLVCTCALADRIMLTPSAVKVRYRHARFEGMFETTRSGNSFGALAVGLTPEVEAEFFLTGAEGRRALGTMNLSYQYLPPVSDIAPGIAVGVQDAMDRSLGRMYYLALTMRKALDQTEDPLELTMGFGVGSRSGVFVGVVVPFTWQFRLLAEHDLNVPRAGLEYRLHNGLAVRTTFEPGKTLVGARYTLKF